jgi:hypothetical protein
VLKVLLPRVIKALETPYAASQKKVRTTPGSGGTGSLPSHTHATCISHVPPEQLPSTPVHSVVFRLHACTRRLLSAQRLARGLAAERLQSESDGTSSHVELPCDGWWRPTGCATRLGVTRRLPALHSPRREWGVVVVRQLHPRYVYGCCGPGLSVVPPPNHAFVLPTAASSCVPPPPCHALRR